MSSIATRLIIAVLVFLLVTLQYKLWFAKGGVRDVNLLQIKVDEQKQTIQTLSDRNQALSAEVNDLKNGLEAIEELARKDLGLIKEGETFYQFIYPDGEKPSANKQQQAPQ